MKHIPRLAQRDWIGLTIVLAGFGLRLRQVLVNRSLWLDEAMLTNNILARDFAGLFRPLDNDQGAPVGFLLVQKLVTLLLGDSEYALRLVPFLAGILALTLMFLLTRKFADPFAGLFALGLFAVAPSLIYYSSEVKQYSSDVAITLGLILFFTKFNSHKNFSLLALASALVVWFSHPALFVIAALGLTLFVQAVREKDKRQIAALLLVAFIWALSLAALYFVNLRQLSTHQFFLDYWSEGFIPHDASVFAWLVNSLRTPFTDLLGLQIPYLVSGILFLFGMIGLPRRLPRLGLFLLLILFLALFASFLTLYPFAGRMILFLVPIVCLLLAEGVADLTGFTIWLFGKTSLRGNGFGQTESRWKPVRSFVFLALAAALLFSPLSLAAENFIVPKMREHIRPTMASLRENLRDGDAVYVYYWAEHAVRFYAPKYELDISAFVIGADHHSQPALYRLELDALRGRGRVWFLFSHVYEENGFNERDYILDYLNSIGELKREYRQPGTSVYLYLYDLR
jgi:uncharacterized membrane protein